MIHLVIGGSGSGKSAYAEQQITAYGNRNKNTGRQPYLYIATMMPFGAETGKKIERHRKMRAGKGFVSVDCYRNLKGLEIPENRGILLECMSNLAANEMFGKESQRLSEETTDQCAGETAFQKTDCITENDSCEFTALVKKILAGVQHLAEQTPHLVVVTNNVHEDSICYDKETEDYRRLLGNINQQLAAMADVVTEVICGVPVRLKGTVSEEKESGSDCKKEMETWKMTGNRGEGAPENNMKIVIGGAYQGKTAYAKKLYPQLPETVWADGRNCALDEIFTCGGIHHFHKYLDRYANCVLRRACMSQNEGKKVTGEHASSCNEGVFTKEQVTSIDFNRIGEDLAEDILLCNPDLILVSDEIGCGIVPVDPFERACREMVGRTVTKLATSAVEVHRVSMGVGTVIKKES